jgi:transcription antitermination factor NusG
MSCKWTGEALRPACPDKKINFKIDLMISSTSKKWYAVYTRPKWEKKVAELLSRKHIENYCPLNRVQRQWSDRKKIVLEPLFTSYVFVSIPETELWEIRKTDGVINFVYFLAKPAIIRNEEIETIKEFLTNYDNVQLDKTSVNVDDHIRITDGAFIHMEGNVLELRHKSVLVMLPSLGYNLIAEIKKDHITVLPTAERQYASK